MPMKLSLALGPRQPLSHQTAWGCLTSNLALPGSGSLLAGRISGYAQLALAAAGLLMTIGFGSHFFAWYVANYSRLHNPDADQFTVLGDLWQASRGALLGILVFGVAWLWGLSTGLHLLQTAKKAPPPPPVPPRLT